MLDAVLLTGAPGTGKSTTLEVLSTLLEIEKVPHGALEVEQLAWGWPWLSVGQAAEQLHEVLAIQSGAGRRLFVLAVAPYDPEEMRIIRAAVPANSLLVVCLSASPQTVAARIDDRERDAWPGKADLIARARGLSTTVPRLEGIDLTIDTESLVPEDVAIEIRDAMSARGMLSAERRS